MRVEGEVREGKGRGGMPRITVINELVKQGNGTSRRDLMQGRE